MPKVGFFDLMLWPNYRRASLKVYERSVDPHLSRDESQLASRIGVSEASFARERLVLRMCTARSAMAYLVRTASKEEVGLAQSVLERMFDEHYLELYKNEQQAARRAFGEDSAKYGSPDAQVTAPLFLAELAGRGEGSVDAEIPGYAEYIAAELRSSVQHVAASMAGLR